VKLQWKDLGTARADDAHGKRVEISGWPTTLLPVASADHFLLTCEASCCAGCVPANPLAVIEVAADQPIELASGALRLAGTLLVQHDDPQGWRYQLKAARLVGVTRRRLLAASPLVCLPMPALAQPMDGMAVDVHSYAGNLIPMSFGRGSFSPVAEPMRQGGLAMVCLAIVADSPIIRLTDGRLRPSRSPNPGELYAFSQGSFAKLHALAGEQRMPLLTTAAHLRAARSTTPSIIVSSEGADFLEGRIERLAEAYQRWTLRHLQLTHDRPNELGDIQTEPSVNDGLTAFGAEVIRQCNRMGIVVDVAHGTYELVKKAAAVTRKPLVLSHTSLTQRAQPWTRLITAEHAKALASTGGVIGIWPQEPIFPTYKAYAEGFARTVDVVGIDHVGLGTDQLGLVGGSTMPSYADLPQLAAALRARFGLAETSKLLGGNYRRVFEASLG
jgi:membrane dipeptidase